MTNVLINGEQKDTISVFDRGLHYGDGVFESMAIQNGKVRLWDEHWNRLAEGCKRLAIDLPEQNKIEKEINSVCRDEVQAVIKLIVTRGEGLRGYRFPEKQNVTHIVLKYPWTTYPVEYTSKGVAVRYCDTVLSENKRLAGIKHLNRLEQVLARNEWDTNECQEGLMLTPQGNVVDGTMSNIFAVKDNIIFTPDLSLSGVSGVMRNAIINLAKNLGFAVQVKNITAPELEDMDEVFLTNSLFGLWPVRLINDTSFSIGNVTKALQIEMKEKLGVE